MKLEIVPPVALISSAVKSVDDSDRVNVNVAVSPAFNALSLVVIAMLGTTVSTVNVTVLEDALFSFPAALLNLAEATLISPLTVLLVVGVNTAV